MSPEVAFLAKGELGIDCHGEKLCVALAKEAALRVSDFNAQENANMA